MGFGLAVRIVRFETAANYPGGDSNRCKLRTAIQDIKATIRDEHRQCNTGGGVSFAVLLGSDNSYTAPFKSLFQI